MRRYLTLLLALAIGVLAFNASSAGSERLNYKVLYKWGFIHKKAGTATFTLTSSGSTLKAVVTARSENWADRFYHLRDTLISKMHASDFTPIYYERIAHENGKYANDRLVFTRKDKTITAHSTRRRRSKKSTEINVTTTTLSAQGKVVDLLSSFYYLRSLKFGSMSPGSTIKINIFSGKRKELLTIRYTGTTSLKFNGKHQTVYKVKFTFTSEGGKQTSDPIEAWLSTEPRHIPLKLVGKLKVGEVQCIYVN